jgi:hypothetical protein
VTTTSDNLRDRWLHSVEALLEPYRHRVAYGNLRAQTTEWNSGGEKMTNLAVVYELPGGSTNQINVSYNHASCRFSFLGLDADAEQVSEDPEQAMAMLRQAVREIPERRLQRLFEDIDRWFGEGKTSHEMFQEINSLMQTDFKGGSLTLQELKAGIHYVLELGHKHADAAS